MSLVITTSGSRSFKTICSPVYNGSFNDINCMQCVIACPVGTRVTGKMVSALKKCGFDRVYDTNFGADLTIMEEGNELLDRLKNNGVLPMFTSCSPG